MNANAKQTDFCVYLSVILLAGLILHALLAWWWSDPIDAPGVAPLFGKEGLE
jgi:divalent metal cation (Fe/Co/Zn/Cd) transporter